MMDLIEVKKIEIDNLSKKIKLNLKFNYYKDSEFYKFKKELIELLEKYDKQIDTVKKVEPKDEEIFDDSIPDDFWEGMDEEE